MIPAFKRVFPKDFETSQLENNVATSLTPVLKMPFLGGVLIDHVALQSGVPNSIAHGLGRAVQGWILTDNTAACTVWRSEGSLPTKQFFLNTSANTTVSLVVY